MQTGTYTIQEFRKSIIILNNTYDESEWINLSQIKPNSMSFSIKFSTPDISQYITFALDNQINVDQDPIIFSGIGEHDYTDPEGVVVRYPQSNAAVSIIGGQGIFGLSRQERIKVKLNGATANFVIVELLFNI
jgi:hypothetical protein